MDPDLMLDDLCQTMVGDGDSAARVRQACRSGVYDGGEFTDSELFAIALVTLCKVAFRETAGKFLVAYENDNPDASFLLLPFRLLLLDATADPAALHRVFESMEQIRNEVDAEKTPGVLGGQAELLGRLVSVGREPLQPHAGLAAGLARMKPAWFFADRNDPLRGLIALQAVQLLVALGERPPVPLLNQATALTRAEGTRLVIALSTVPLCGLASDVYARLPDRAGDLLWLLQRMGVPVAVAYQALLVADVRRNHTREALAHLDTIFRHLREDSSRELAGFVVADLATQMYAPQEGSLLMRGHNAALLRVIDDFNSMLAGGKLAGVLDDARREQCYIDLDEPGCFLGSADELAQVQEHMHFTAIAEPSSWMCIAADAPLAPAATPS